MSIPPDKLEIYDPRSPKLSYSSGPLKYGSQGFDIITYCIDEERDIWRFQVKEVFESGTSSTLKEGSAHSQKKAAEDAHDFLKNYKEQQRILAHLEELKKATYTKERFE